MAANDEEKACAEAFLNWHGRQCGVSYALARAEEVFPKLKDKGIWDFVATPNDIRKEQCAIEVKQLVRPHARHQKNQWGKLVARLTEDLGGSLCGKFSIIPGVILNPPRGTKYKYGVLKLNHRNWSRFVGAFKDAILQNAARMKTHDIVDLGPAIVAQFPSWPRHPQNAYELWLVKTADNGCSIKVAPTPDAFWVEEALRNAIDDLDMTTQLRLAREQGIKYTILLLDCRIDWSPDTMRQVLIDKGFSPPSVDYVYAVEVSRKEIHMVWSSGKTI